MHISNSAISKLKVYLIVLSSVFVCFFLFTTVGIGIQEAAYEDYYSSDVEYDPAWEATYDLGGLFLAVGSVFLFTGMIMVFVITGIILFINRFKMVGDVDYE